VNGEVKVEPRRDRLPIAASVVNPRVVETQLEGGMIYGLSAALFGEITIKNGRVEQGATFDTIRCCASRTPKTESTSAHAGRKWGRRRARRDQ